MSVKRKETVPVRRLGMRGFRDKEGDKLAREAQELRSSLKKTVAMGAYIISDEAAEVLRTLREEFEKAEALAFDGPY
jgi:hypothetical protein